MGVPGSTAVTRVGVALPRLVILGGLARQPAAWIAALAFGLYLPPALSVLQLNPDVVEYVDIGRHLAAGQGNLLSVKMFHVGGTQVLQDGLAVRPPLWPFLIAALFWLGVSPLGLQVVNALLSAGCAALVYGIGTALFDRRTGLLAGLLAALSPAVLIFMIPPMSEALAIGLTLVAAWLLVRRSDRACIADCAAAGAALGLGYLARPTTLAFAAALVLGVVLAARVRRALLRPLAALFVGLAIFVVPITVYSLATRGSPSYSQQTYQYAVFEDSDVKQNATLRPLPTPGEFVQASRIPATTPGCCFLTANGCSCWGWPGRRRCSAWPAGATRARPGRSCCWRPRISSSTPSPGPPSPAATNC
jgi:Dolichyl-phosphate-mannose-protein mannosyltransferase